MAGLKIRATLEDGTVVVLEGPRAAELLVRILGAPEPAPPVIAPWECDPPFVYYTTPCTGDPPPFLAGL
jgi:hypothetical protein